jgi:hypothetical protein
MLDFFKKGGVFLFDEEDSRSESSYYRLEDLMGEEAGQDITETYIDEDGEICIYYDGSVISEEKAIEKYNNGDFKKSL